MVRGQFKIQQMAFVLLAIFLFFILVGIFVMSIYSQSLEERGEAVKENRATVLVESLVSSAELGCGGKSHCIDADKAMVLLENENYKDYWKDIASIRLISIYPENEIGKCGKTYRNCNEIVVLDKKVQESESIANFVSLCRKASNQGGIYNKCEIAKLVVAYEENE